MRFCLILLIFLSGTAGAHSLEPPYRLVRFHEGFTRFPMEALNAFQHTEEFEVEVFADDSFSEVLDFHATPPTMRLQPMGRREFTIEMYEVDLPDFLVCTRTNVDGGSSRVCSRVLVCRPVDSSAVCKRRLSERRGEYLIGR